MLRGMLRGLLRGLLRGMNSTTSLLRHWAKSEGRV
jgi:hypothetical protein